MRSERGDWLIISKTYKAHIRNLVLFVLFAYAACLQAVCRIPINEGAIIAGELQASLSCSRIQFLTTNGKLETTKFKTNSLTKINLKTTAERERDCYWRDSTMLNDIL